MNKESTLEEFNTGEKETITIGNRKIELTKTEEKFLRASMGIGGIVGMGIGAATYFALAKREPSLMSAPETSAIFIAPTTAVGMVAGDQAGEKIIGIKRDLQEKWENFKSNKEENKE